MTLIECSGVFPEISPGSKIYRYFNQPIEQIPGYSSGVSQMLFHGAAQGLYWQTIPDCVELPKCVTVETDSPGSTDYKIIAQKTRIRPLQTLGDLPDPVECADFPTELIDVVTCIRLEGNNLVIDRKSVLIIKDMGMATTVCENIPLVSCNSSSSTSTSSSTSSSSI